MKKVIHLVPKRRMSRDTVRCLRKLLAEAESGNCLGVAFASFHSDSQPQIHACGDAYTDPLTASGAVGALWLDLQVKARG